MTIARSTGAFFGTNETTGITIANNASPTPAVTDMLGDNASVGNIWLYACLTGTGTTGSLQLKVNCSRIANGGTELYVSPSYQISIPPINGTQSIPLGLFPIDRYVSVDVLNNGTGGNLTNVSILYTLEKIS